MMWYLLSPCLLVVAMFAAVAPAAAQSSQQPFKKVSWKWTGEMVNWEAYSGHQLSAGGATLGEYAEFVSIRFTYIQESDERGRMRFTNRRINWTAVGWSGYAGVWWVTCKGNGDVELGPSEGAPSTTPAQEQALRIPCEKPQTFGKSSINFFRMPGGQIQPPDIVDLKQLRDDCTYSEEHEGYRYSVSLSPAFEAYLDLDTSPTSAYARFIPVPGEDISFTVRTVPAVPAYFRFTVVKDSTNVTSWPGFAMNADIDDAFFTRYPKIRTLGGIYKRDDWDLIFNPDAHPGPFWKTGDKRTRMWEMETAKEATQVTVAVTAMDYGAFGILRPEFRTKCTGWQDVTIRGDPDDKPFVFVPFDRNRNLIADAQERTIHPRAESDDDDQPPGDGTPGDGLTAFEEYRGFMTAPSGCRGGLKHERTSPRKKDLFVYADDQKVAEIVANWFPQTSGLAVRLVCPEHVPVWMDDRTRIINFTLHGKGAPKEGPYQVVVTLDKPQHFVWLHTYPDSERGSYSYESSTGDYGDTTGTPGSTSPISVDPIEYAYGEAGRKQRTVFVNAILHDLGHSVNVCHHGDGNIWGGILLDVSACPPPLVPVTVDGKPACKFSDVAVRHGENSGEQDCPMRWNGWNTYVPRESPGGVLEPAGEVTYKWLVSSGPGYREYDEDTGYAYRGLLRPYSKADRPGTGRFAASVRGTGINTPGPNDHCGYAKLVCSKQVRVNDVAASVASCEDRYKAAAAAMAEGRIK